MLELRLPRGYQITNDAAANMQIPIEFDFETREGPMVVTLSPALQNYIVEKLRLSDGEPRGTLDVVFQTVNSWLSSEYNITVNEEDLDLFAVADFIGYKYGLWPDPQVLPVEYEDQGSMGVLVRVPQRSNNEYLNNKYMAFNTNELRFIYNHQQIGHSQTDTHGSLNRMRAQNELLMRPQRLYTMEAIEVTTIGRLRIIIKERSQNCPENERRHWNRVKKPYEGRGDGPSVVFDSWDD
ncbi:MAG: hypothetical protein HETSPECPRED_005830 [Heterodermia speciosa]|uniref:Uncharacterized protein n=1 Tax=Heterodermia speciosa TaxID=116794 RepID=A0A8H3IEU4_9LECA|nr:MAG: hypothetical protein HETSPECPRED_005830 [Heterodermia speciosa]